MTGLGLSATLAPGVLEVMGFRGNRPPRRIISPITNTAVSGADKI
jgi:hypothetical protein